MGQRIHYRFLSYIIILLIIVQCQPLNETITAPDVPTTSPTIEPTVTLAQDADLLDVIRQREILRIGIRIWPSAEYTPPAFRGASNAVTGGILQGFEVDVAKVLAEGLELELELVEAYPPVINSGDWQGAWDIALATLTPQNTNEEVLYSEPYGYLPLALAVPTNSEISSIDQLGGQPVAVLEHSTYHQAAIQAGQIPVELQLVPVSSLPKAIRQLGSPENNEFAALFGPTPILQAAQTQGETIQLLQTTQPAIVQPLVVAVAPQDDWLNNRLLEEINQVFQEAHRQGILAEIYLQWYGEDLSRY